MSEPVKWLGGVVLVAAMAGCGGGGADPAPSASMLDQAFVATMRARFPNMTRDVMFKDRDATCAAIAEDPTHAGWVVAVHAFTANGISAEDAGFFIGAAVRTGCPQYMSALP